MPLGSIAATTRRAQSSALAQPRNRAGPWQDRSEPRTPHDSCMPCIFERSLGIQPGQVEISDEVHEGWRLMCNKFDDGGLSGASLERPALQALLDEVRSGASEIEQMAFFARFLLREQPLASQTTSESRPSHTFSKPNYLPG
jgi:hypothetical protein